MKNYSRWDVIVAGFACIFALGMILLAAYGGQLFELTEIEPEVVDEDVTTEIDIPEVEEVEPVVTEIIEPSEPIVEEPEVLYFNVPLDEELQDHIFQLCEDYSIEPALVMAVIERESNFRDYVVGDSGESYGLMQIKQKWHKARMESLGVTDLLDPYQNVMVGIDYLGELFASGNGIEWALMAYNGGGSYANKMVSSGKVSDYANGVLDRAYELRMEVESVG